MMKKDEANTTEIYVVKMPLSGKKYATIQEGIKECRGHLIAKTLMRKFMNEIKKQC